MVTLPNTKSGSFRFANEEGIVHTLPLLVIVAAVGLISFLLITSTLPITGLFENLNPKPPSRAAGEGFLETFAYGVPTAPQPFKSSRWIIGYGGNQNGDTNVGSEVQHPLIEAGHGPNCQGPMGNADPNLNIHLLQNTHTVDLVTYYKDHAAQQFFLCNNHMMTINKSGGDALFFMPRYLLDWSGGRTANLQFDTNPEGWSRNWWDVYIAPPEELLFTANFSKRAVIFGNVSHHFQIRRIANYNISQREDPDTGYCSATADPACNDPRIRRTHKISFNTTNWSMSVVKPDGTLFTQSGTWDTPLDFTSGMVLMTHYNYNPTKESNLSLNPSMITYHWANFMFDGPATRLMTGYSAPPQYITTVSFPLNGRPAGKNPSDLIHINVTSSDLRNPRIWGVLGGRDSCGNSGCPDKTHTDPKNTTRWGEVSLNGGPWLIMPTIRELGALNQPYPNDTGMGFETSIPANYPSPVREGDNTLQFRSNNYVGFQIHTVEIQVDPNSDLPLANTGGCAGPEVGGNCTPGPSIPVPPGPPPPSPPPPPTPPPGSPNPGTVTVDFNIDPVGVINGQYPSGIINWGTNAWVGSGPYSVFSTNSFSFNGNTVNSGTFSLLDSRRVVSIQAANGGTVASSVTIGCPGNPTVTANVPLNQLTTITTNWPANCTGPVTITSTNGWNTNFDNLALSANGVTPPPSPPAPTPGPTPACTLGDIDCDGDVDIFDFNTLISNFGQTGANLQGDLDTDGDIDIFDFNSLISNFGN